MFSGVGLVVVIFLCALATLVVLLVWQSMRPDKTERWPVVEGMIQSVNTEITYQGRGTTAKPVGDFSYCIGGEYYSGRLGISGFDVPDVSPRGLVGKKISVRYNPEKPQEFFVPSVVLGGFHLGQHYELFFQNDTEPTVLNIGKS